MHFHKQRTVGSLTSEDLGVRVKVNGHFTTPLMVIHSVDEGDGTEYTMLCENTALLFPMTVTSDTPFEVEP